MGRLPGQINANIQMVNGLRQQLESISVQLRGEQDRLSMIESQLDAMRQGAGGALTSTAAATVQSTRARISPSSSSSSRSARSARRTAPRHHHAQRGDRPRAGPISRRPPQAGTGAGHDDLLQTDPVYRQRMLDRDNVRVRIRMLQVAEGQARAQIAQYQSRVEAAPMVEQDLSSVQRDYELEKGRYADLRKQHDAAIDAEELARKQGGERFSVLYPAYLPTSPASAQPAEADADRAGAGAGGGGRPRARP